MQTGNGTLIHTDWEPHSTHRLGMVDYYGTHIPHADWEWDPRSTHRLGTAFHTQTRTTFHTQTGKGTLIPCTLGMGPLLHTQT